MLVTTEIDVEPQNYTRETFSQDERLAPLSTYSFCEPNHLFFPKPLWQYMLLLFAVFRVAYPFLLMKTDSYLRQKINFIVR